MQPMAWSFGTQGRLSPSGRPLKRPASRECLAPHAKHHVAGQLMAAAVPHGGSAEAAAAAAAPPSQTADGIDVAAVAAKHGWDLQQRNDYSNDRQVQWIPVAAIRRPLQGTRSNDPEKVAALMKSIEEIGLQEPIDVLEVDGKIYGFSGCHRFEAHQRLGRDQILCRVRKATPQVLKFHMM